MISATTTTQGARRQFDARRRVVAWLCLTVAFMLAIVSSARALPTPCEMPTAEPAPHMSCCGGKSEAPKDSTSGAACPALCPACEPTGQPVPPPVTSTIVVPEALAVVDLSQGATFDYLAALLENGFSVTQVAASPPAHSSTPIHIVHRALLC
ncbi:hypothetical protein GC173_16185 [bacterium]|nr:hypothetical protein [bacterium]